MKRVKSEKDNRWKIVLLKLINGVEPIYYRIVNLYSYDIESIPAYAILDEVVNKGLDIINLKCKNNKPVIIDENGYESLDEIIVIDEFNNEIPNIWDWCLEHGEVGNNILNSYNIDRNVFSPESFKVNSSKKLAWTCKNNHTIYCGFPTYASTNGKCPICELKDNGEIPSLAYWARVTNNKELLEMYESAVNNTESSSNISYKARKKIWLNNGKEEIQEVLSNITIKGIKPHFNDEDNKPINLNKN